VWLRPSRNKRAKGMERIMMGEYIRGVSQLKAIYYFIEQLWIFLIGRDSRGMSEEEKKFVIYCGREFRFDRLRCAKRGLEIATGFAKTYEIVFAPTFWESLRNIGASEEDIKELKEKYES